MLSHRLPAERAPNAWARALEAKRRAAGTLLDLAEANPTRVGLGGAEAAGLRGLADPRGARYEPDARGLASARAAIARYYADRGTPVAPEHLVLTAGTSEGYAHVFRLLADPGDSVLVPAPSYPLFEPLARLEGVAPVPYRLAYDGAWHLDRASLEEAVAGCAGRARAIVVVEPNHPTGTCLSTDEIETVCSLCERHGLAVVSDEVFGDYPWPASAAPLRGWSASDRVPAFVLSGLSKVCGLPQLKLGWIAVAGPGPLRREALDGLEWIADLFLSVSTPVQLALPELLGARSGFQTRLRRRLAANLESIEALSRRHPEVTRLRAMGGWVAILKLPARRSGETWALDLLDREVVVHPGHFYDIPGEATIVVSLIVEPTVLERGLERLADLL